MIKRIKLKLKKLKIPRSVGYLILCGFLILVGIGAWLGVDCWDEVFPTEETLAEQQHLLKKLRQELEFETQKRRALESDLTRLHGESAYFYFSGDNRRADVFMRQKLEEIAKHAGVVVKSLSDIRKQSIVKGVCSWEADVMVFPMTRGKQELEGHHFPIETPEKIADFIFINSYPVVHPLDAARFLGSQAGRSLNVSAKSHFSKRSSNNIKDCVSSSINIIS